MIEPMIELRPFNTLGAANHGWLDARHHFSFANYHDPARVHWGALRVWNDDKIAPGTGFPTHPHSDMEIITYVRSGAITHRDSMGNERTGAFVPLASGVANDNDALRIRADARVLGATILAGQSVTYTPRSADRHLYLVPATGRLRIDTVEANARDGVAITGLAEVTITALEDSEVVLVDAA